MSGQRRFNRLEQEANVYFQPLIQKFIDFKNAHFIEQEGCLKFQPEVYVLFHKLNSQFQEFATKINGCKWKNIELKYDSFEKNIATHLHQHFKLCWISYATRLLKFKHQIEPDQELLDVIYHLCFKPKFNDRQLLTQNQICTPLKYRKKEFSEASLQK